MDPKFRISEEEGFDADSFESHSNRNVYNSTTKKKTNLADHSAIVPVVDVIDESKLNNINESTNSSATNTSVTTSTNTVNNNIVSDYGEYEAEFSFRDVNSTTNLLMLHTKNDSFYDAAEVKFTNGKILINNSKVNDNNLLKPSAKIGFNNASQSSIDTRVKYLDDIPLIAFNQNSQASNPDAFDETKSSGEKWYFILLQVLLPFIIAGFGMVGAGVVLDIVQHWELFINIPAIFTLIPALLGLKGNLEMTLASRFSTQVNLGKVSDSKSILSAVLGNFALTQAQAIIVGFLASVGATILRFIFEKDFDLRNSLVLVSGSMSTASFASLLLAGLMMFVIILSKRLRINPDNIATPIAASLGDLVTLTILSYLCTFLYQIKYLVWIHVIIVLMFFVLVPIFCYYSHRNDFVKDALYNGWIPIIAAMVISSTGGFIMGFAVRVYKDIAVFQPVVNGVGGNLVAIFASRLSTALHRTSTQGTKPDWAPKKWYHFSFDTYFGKSNPESNTALVLSFLSVPGHLLFYFTITYIKKIQNDPINPATQTPSFIVFYTSVLILQVVLLLLFCYWLVHLAWRNNRDPDNVCIPYLTAIGDLLGTAFLAFCFHMLYLAGETRLRNPH